jgi:hypothetical protein
MGRALILGPLVLLAILAQPIMIPAQPINTRAEMLRFEARELPNAPMPPKPPKPAPPPPPARNRAGGDDGFAQPINTRAEMLRFEARELPNAPMQPKPQPKPQPQLP